MKRFLVALSTLPLLLMAAPTAAVPTKASALCNGLDSPEAYLNSLIGDIHAANWQGPLCLKACKAEFQICKKVASSRRKCQEAVAKGTSKQDVNTCLLAGGDKKICTENAKVAAKGQRDGFKAAFLGTKEVCEDRHDVCRTECAD